MTGTEATITFWIVRADPHIGVAIPDYFDFVTLPCQHGKLLVFTGSALRFVEAGKGFASIRNPARVCLFYVFRSGHQAYDLINSKTIM